MTLRVNSLTGFGGGSGFSFALVDTDTTQNNTNSPSFSGLTAGKSARQRLLFVVIVCNDADVADDTFWPETCTIGGITATKVASNDRGVAGKSLGVAIYNAFVPNGDAVTVDITVAFSGTMDDWACALFRATKVSETALDTGGTIVSIELDTNGGKFALLGAADSDSTNTSWTGGGNTLVAVTHNKLIIGYDDAPLGGAADVYNVNVDGDAFSGAVFG